MRAAILALLVSWPLALQTASPDLRLTVGRDVYELSAFSEPLGGAHYFGAFRSPYALTGGTALHLFPNAKFVIANFLDIAEDSVLAVGSYKVVRNTLSLSFDNDQGDPSIRRQFSGLHIAWGWMNKGSYVTGFEVFILTTPEWQKLISARSDITYMQRFTEYNDWQATLRNYEAQMPNKSLERTRDP